MKRKRHNSQNKIKTPQSETTVYIDYKAKKMELEVEFKEGKAYHYLNVPLPVWEEYRNIVLSGGSSGTFVNYEIKPTYPCEPID